MMKLYFTARNILFMMHLILFTLRDGLRPKNIASLSLEFERHSLRDGCGQNTKRVSIYAQTVVLFTLCIRFCLLPLFSGSHLYITFAFEINATPP